jgi:hypothetical protein
MPQTVGPTFPVIITSYEVVMNDSKVLARYDWKNLVVNEGHRLKRFQLQIAEVSGKAVRQRGQSIIVLKHHFKCSWQSKACGSNSITEDHIKILISTNYPAFYAHIIIMWRICSRFGY